MTFRNETCLVNFVCTVFEQGDEMLTLSTMEKQLIESNLQPRAYSENRRARVQRCWMLRAYSHKVQKSKDVSLCYLSYKTSQNMQV